ncbi:DUF2787 domain-containing protein [Vibrio crassostreae]|uniref:DUF2787 domain-containing protein n=1 Tax=Vibrio crassostreae TaxID=246167 RepID=UPI0006394E18|nr:DUF2787 domain-containing protein [Vibrio crassostreae]TCT49697.1 uncharacterized protein DUF2787 [Vibrio crassostreae]TCT74800.1 uncharacterized protein DUF2787 [Vibrio crassostreae]TCT94580.1 uncharacterized protein DUF2787 [Vibrio crassostreae]CAK2300288.1 DUF2787 domain-containing protein [Vibrio crassostreae]CAK2420301.1 DUF2787 domain-containing protein [Vibrio crassostreae]
MKPQTLTITAPYSPVSQKLKSLLKSKMETFWKQNPTKKDCESLTINFRDTTYSAEAGGYHPVEIMLLKENESQYQIQYLTDFAYQGNVYPELERNVDFDIANGQAFIAPMGWQAIDAYGINDFYKIWESNFLSYLDMESYDQIEISN